MHSADFHANAFTTSRWLRYEIKKGCPSALLPISTGDAILNCEFCVASAGESGGALGSRTPAACGAALLCKSSCEFVSGASTGGAAADAVFRSAAAARSARACVPSSHETDFQTADAAACVGTGVAGSDCATGMALTGPLFTES